ALVGIYLGQILTTDKILGSLAQSKFTWGLFAVVFCFISAVLPIWRFTLPIAVITRFLKWFHDFGIPVGGIIVNGLLPPPESEQAPDFVRNRFAMQAEHMKTIWQLFDGQVRALVPLFDNEIQGIPALNRLAEILYG
ncbi:MAG: ArsA-related P-loop ATPase, partial [Pseudomonadota bacterium]